MSGHWALKPAPASGRLPVLLLYNIDRGWPLDAQAEAAADAEELGEKLRHCGHTVTLVCLTGQNLSELLANHDPTSAIVFNWCEEIPGLPRSAALVAQVLEQMRFTFTGADSAALALSQDKRRVKETLVGLGIPTPRWEILTTSEKNGWECFPAIVKPVYEHCSFGITPEAVVSTPAQLRDRVKYVLEEFQQPALVEDFIDGREFHVSVVGNGTLHAFTPAEMDFSAFTDYHERLCTYASKFEPASRDFNLIEMRLPAPLTEHETAELVAISKAAYRSAGCRDYARLDIRLREGIFYVLDINPNADFSADTSLALAAEMEGITHAELASILIELAARRQPR